MKILTKPRKPTRQKHSASIHIDDMTLEEVIKEVERAGLSFDRVKITMGGGYYDDCGYAIAEYWVPVLTDDEYALVINKWEANVKKWEKWSKDHENEIKAELHKRKLAKKIKQRDTLLQKKKELEAKLKKL